MRSFRKRAALSRVSKIVAVAVVIAVIVISGAVIIVIAGSSKGKPLSVYVADSYTNEATSIGNAFEKAKGTSTVSLTSGGSLALARDIALGAPADVFVSVSESAVGTQYLGSEAPGWAISFASDSMTIAYSNLTSQNPSGMNVLSDYSSAATMNNSADWYKFFYDLTSGSLKVGISNPNSDPAGYRGWLVLEAAGYVYANNESFFSNRLIENRGNVTASSAALLESPLETGQIQFLFTYLSASVSVKLNAVHLINGINLGSASYSNFYSKFNYTLSSGVQLGSPILLWITVPKTTTNQGLSLEFVKYVVENSSSILTEFGLSTFEPPKLYNSTAVPSLVSEMLSAGFLGYGGALS